MVKCKCKRCSYVWEARIKKPKCCPDCKSRRWDVTPKEAVEAMK